MFDKCPPVVLLDYIMNPDGVALILAIKGATGKNPETCNILFVLLSKTTD